MSVASNRGVSLVLDGCLQESMAIGSCTSSTLVINVAVTAESHQEIFCLEGPSQAVRLPTSLTHFIITLLPSINLFRQGPLRRFSITHDRHSNISKVLIQVTISRCPACWCALRSNAALQWDPISDSEPAALWAAKEYCNCKAEFSEKDGAWHLYCMPLGQF